MEKEENLYNIRQVIELTGLSEFTLRGWETRYHAFVPLRTDTGRRLYKRDDVLKIKALKDLVERGYRIGSVAGLLLEDLTGLLENSTTPQHPNVDPDILKILQFAERFEWDQVSKTILKKRSSLEPKDFILDFILGLIYEMNRLVESQKLSIAQEHILSSMIKENLYYLRTNAPLPTKKDIRIIFAAPEGDLHEIGLLIAATLASLARLPSLYVGANTPKGQICDVCLRFKATHLVISSTVSKTEGAKDELLSYMNFIDRQLSPDTTIWLGGRHSMDHSIKLSRPFKIISSLQEQYEMFLALHKKNKKT